jgi:hypothetical protein
MLLWYSNRRLSSWIAARQAEVEAKAQMRIVRSSLRLTLHLSFLHANGNVDDAASG